MIHQGGIGLVLIAIIAVVFLLTAVLLALTVFRRAYNLRKYKRMDRERLALREALARWFATGAVPGSAEALRARPKTVRWLALESVLLDRMADQRHRERAGALFDALGYVEFYRRRLDRRSVIRKASAIDMLGKMRSAASTELLVPMLDDERPEIVAVTVRALSRIGTPAALTAILRRMPGLLTRSRITRKSIETALKNFGPACAPTLIEFGNRYVDPAPKASILEVLANMGAPGALPFAGSVLDHADPEVRSKAVKLIGAAGAEPAGAFREAVRSRLTDPVWFVRLQAARAAGNLRDTEAEEALAMRLLDGNWQVRNAAALSLTQLSDRAVDIFLATLQDNDRYAKESICEEIEKTNFVGRLIENLGSTDPSTRDRSRRILGIMRDLGYSTPLSEYLKAGGDPRIRGEIGTLMGEGPAA